MRKKHLYKIDKLVIGTDLSALIYAYLHNYTFIFKEIIKPTTFEFLPSSFPLEVFHHNKKIIEMCTLDGKISFGTPKVELWNRLIFLMSCSGLLPFGLKETAIREDGDTVTIKTRSRNYYYEVGEVIKLKNTFHKYKVYDWIDVRSCGDNHLEYVATTDDFVSEVFFYPSTRVGTKQNDKDILVVSNLSESQLNSFDYGETMTRIRTKVLLHELGIRGPRNGKNPSYPKSREKYKYAPIKLEHSYREIRRDKTNNSEIEMVEMFFKKTKQLPEDTYLYRLNKRISKERLL